MTFRVQSVDQEYSSDMYVMTGSDSRANKDLRIVNESCIPSMIPSLENLVCSNTRGFLLKDVVTLLFHLENRLHTLKPTMFFLQLTIINFRVSLLRVLLLTSELQDT